MSGVRVTKMSGAGNDFVVLAADELRRVGQEPLEWIRAICRRGLSLGADGVVVVEPGAAGRLRVSFHNPDGSRAFCGNGTRCAVRFAVRAGLAASPLEVQTDAGLVPAELLGERVRLVLPAPTDRGEREVVAAGERLRGRFVVAGVPHFVLAVPDVERAPLGVWGPLARRDPLFGGAGTNVDVVAPDPGGGLRLRTWERGVEGETLACGSGAVAVAFVAGEGGVPPGGLRVVPRSGIAIEIRPGSARGTVEMLGDARFVCDASVSEEATRHGSALR